MIKAIKSQIEGLEMPQRKIKKTQIFVTQQSKFSTECREFLRLKCAISTWEVASSERSCATDIPIELIPMFDTDSVELLALNLPASIKFSGLWNIQV